MTCGLVHASYCLPEWQAVKLTFFAPSSLMSKTTTLHSFVNFFAVPAQLRREMTKLTKIVWKDAKSIFQRRFHGLRRCRIVCSQLSLTKRNFYKTKASVMVGYLKCTFWQALLYFRERYVSMAFMKKYIHVAKTIKVSLFNKLRSLDCAQFCFDCTP